MWSIVRVYPVAGGWVYWRPDVWRWVRAHEVTLEAAEDVAETAQALGLSGTSDQTASGPELYALDVAPDGRRARARLAAGVED